MLSYLVWERGEVSPTGVGGRGLLIVDVLPAGLREETDD